MQTLPLAITTDSWTWQIANGVIFYLFGKFADWLWQKRTGRAGASAPNPEVSGPAPAHPSPEARAPVFVSQNRGYEGNASYFAMSDDREERGSAMRAARAGGSTALTEREQFISIVVLAVAAGLGVLYLFFPRSVQLGIVGLAAFSFAPMRRIGKAMAVDAGDDKWRKFSNRMATIVGINVLSALALWLQPFGGDTHRFLDAATYYAGPRATFEASGLGEYLLFVTSGLGVAVVLASVFAVWRSTLGLRLEISHRNGHRLRWPASAFRRAEERRSETPRAAFAWAASEAVLAVLLCSGAVAAAQRAFGDNGSDLAAPRILVRLSSSDSAKLRVASSERAQLRVTASTKRSKNKPPRTVFTTSMAVEPGRNTVALKLAKADRSRRLTIRATATDEAGNKSGRATVTRPADRRR